MSTHTHACNLLLDSGELIALVGQRHGNGPFHIVVPAAMLANFHTGEPITYKSGMLITAAHYLDFDQAAQWNPHLPACTFPLSAPILALLATASAAYPTSPLFALTNVQNYLQRRAAQGLQSLTVGLQSGNLNRIAEGATDLAGLGSGLTPAGDDFLVGWLAALFIQPAPKPFGIDRAAIGAQVEAAAGATTRLSAAWLQCAARGQFGAAWHALAHALDIGERGLIQQTATHILSTGATSGVDAFGGLLRGLEMLQPLQH
ncbi:MAG: DUF2877 domain-containing protein [Chloroflexota bacterium]|nr:DUF2877 domain-containing protein [Chloroflexota bacterium]